MSIYELAAKLGQAIKEDERMIRMEKAKEAYESSEKIGNLMMEYGIQQQALTTMGDGDEIDTDFAVEQFFGGGDISVTRTADLLNALNGFSTQCQCRNTVNAAQTADLSDTGLKHGIENRRVHISPRSRKSRSLARSG